jgi:hypothetical protein
VKTIVELKDCDPRLAHCISVVAEEVCDQLGVEYEYSEVSADGTTVLIVAYSED